MKFTTKLFLLSTLTASLLASCRPSDGPVIGFALPGELHLAELSADARERLFATIEIDDLLDERPLQIAPDLSEVTGVFELDGVDEPQSATFTLRLWLDGEDEAAPDVLLARATGTANVEPQTNTELVPEGGDNPFDTCGAPAPPCEVALDLNRNDRPNLEDLAAGVDPTPPPPFTDIAPSTLQFPSGIRLGSFARQVIVVENTTGGVIEASARIINAPGATLSRYDTDEGGTVQDRGLRSIDLGEIQPFEERFLAVSFAPVNAFLTTGDVYLESRDPVSDVRQATRVKIIANADGELQPTRDGFDPAPVGGAASLGGFEGEVQIYPAAELWNGLPITGVTTSETVSTGLPYTGRTLRAVFDEDGEETEIPADAVFLVEVEPEHQLSLSLGGLNTDVDLAAMWLDDDDAITADATNNLRSARTGKSPEAIEVRNDTDEKRRALVVLGRVEADAPAAASGALSTEENAQMSLSGQESNPPQITAIDPVIGPLEGGNRVVITGLGFQEGAQVTFANALALDCSWSKDEVTDLTTMDCTTPPGSLEVGRNPATVVVENPSQDEGGDGQAASLLEGYTYLPPAPQLDSLSPRVAPTAGSAGTISINGRFFSTRFGVPRVTFGQVEATSVVFTDSTRLDVLAPAQGAGVVSVSVANRLEGEDAEGNPRWSLPSNLRNFTYIEPQGPAPTLTEVSPATGSVDGGIQVTLSGTDFLLGAQVTFDGKASGNVVFAGPTSLTATLPTRTAPGVVDVEVVNPDGQSSRLVEAFEYFIPAPAVTGVFPAEASTAGGTFIVVNGTGFRAGVQALFVPTGGGDPLLSPNVNRVSAGTVLVATPSVQTGGDYTLRAVNVDGQNADWSGTFRFLEPAGPAPVIEGIDPGTGFNDTANAVTLTGSDFRGALLPSVLVGNESASVDSFIDCPSDPSCAEGSETDTVVFLTPVTTTEGPVVVRLINDDGQSDTSVYTFVKRLGQPPQIFALNPPEGAGGELITLTGFNFAIDDTTGQLLSRLLVRGQPLGASLIDSASDTEIRFFMPEVQTTFPLNVEVTVENPDEQRSSANFLYVPDAGPAPFISQVSPGEGPVGSEVTVTGAYLDVIDQVFFGPVSVSSADYTLTATALTLDVPTGTPLGTSVIRLVDNDEDRTVSASFTVTDAAPAPPPSIYSITPAEVPPAGGTTVTLLGADFDASAVVRVGGATVSGATVTATEATFSAPANPEGTFTVSVTNPDGQSASVPFRYKTPMVVNGEPEAGFVSPERVHASIAGDEVTVVGQNLSGATAASVEGGGSYAASIVGTPSATSVRVRLDAGLPPTNDTGGVPYRVQLSFPSGPITSPPFEAMAPRVVGWSLEEDGSLLVFGEWFHPAFLSGVSLDDGTTTLPFVVSGASEELLFADTTQPLFPGAAYTLQFSYDPLEQPVTPFDSGTTPPTVNGPPLRADIYGQVIADSDPSGARLYGLVERLAEFEAELQSLGGLTFVLESTTGVEVASGTWQPSTMMEGGEEVELTVTSTAAVPQGDYRAVLATARGAGFAETDHASVSASPRRVDDVQPQPALRGDAVAVAGVFIAGDLITAAPDGQPTAVVQLGTVPAGYGGGGGPDGGNGASSPFAFSVPTTALAAGTWNVCAQAPGALADCGTENSMVLNIGPSACGDAVTGLGAGGVVTVTLDKDLSALGYDCGGGPGAVLQVRPQFVGSDLVWIRYLDVAASGAVQVTLGEDLCGGGPTFDSCRPPDDVLGQELYANRANLILQDVGGDGTGTVTVQIGLGYYDQACATPDQDGDGAQPCAQDCRDDNDQVNPGATEVCDGLDNDCDGRLDILGPCTVSGQDGVCAEGLDVCQPGGGTLCEAARGPSSFEICGNGDDDDCDTATDEGDCEEPGVLAIPYAPETLVSPTGLPLGGDEMSIGAPIGFDFPYWGLFARDFFLTSNGTLTFQDSGSQCCGGELPGQGGGIVAFAWGDLRGNRLAGAEYEVFGTAPNRRLVIDVSGFDYYFGGPGYERESVAVQIKLFEGTGEIELHYPRLWGNSSAPLTQGFGDWTGLRAAVAHPLRVQQPWGADGHAVRLLPHQLGAECGDLVCATFAGEDAQTCPQDCDNTGSPPPATCGDGVCEVDPQQASTELFDCPEDCGEGRCGNGVCESGSGEDPGTCPADCGAGVCGNNSCEAGEELFCLQDCGGADYDDDGDGLVTSAETVTSPINPDSDNDLLLDGLEASFSADPQAFDSDTGGEPDGAEVLNGRTPNATPGDDRPDCGDAFCDDGFGEDPTTCLADCWCGNFTCEPTEDASTCPADCGGGGAPPGEGEGEGDCIFDGMCGPGEDPFLCPDDCVEGGCNDDTICDAWEDQGGTCGDCPA